MKNIVKKRETINSKKGGLNGAVKTAYPISSVNVRNIAEKIR
jgi:hypothetical protein